MWKSIFYIVLTSFESPVEVIEIIYKSRLSFWIRNFIVRKLKKLFLLTLCI